MDKIAAEIKNRLRTFREYFPEPVSDKRLELYASTLAKRGYTVECINETCSDLVFTSKRFPSIAEIADAARKHMQLDTTSTNLDKIQETIEEEKSETQKLLDAFNNNINTNNTTIIDFVASWLHAVVDMSLEASIVTANESVEIYQRLALKDWKDAGYPNADRFDLVWDEGRKKAGKPPISKNLITKVLKDIEKSDPKYKKKFLDGLEDIM